MTRLPRPAPLTRRHFLQRSALLAAGFAVPPALLQACGDAGTSGAPLVVDPDVPFWLQGGFAPVYDEATAFDLPVRGRIPDALSGLYVRNGSNPQSGVSPHWFFGDGMLHGVRLEQGRAAWYRNRYVRTPFYEQGREAAAVGRGRRAVRDRPERPVDGRPARLRRPPEHVVHGAPEDRPRDRQPALLRLLVRAAVLDVPRG